MASIVCAGLLSFGCGGGGSGGGSVAEPEPPSPPAIDVQLVNVTVFQGVEVFTTDYVRNASNSAVVDETIEHVPLIEGRQAFLTLTFTQSSGSLVDVDLTRVGESSSLEYVEDPKTNEDGQNEYVYALPGEFAQPSTRLEIEVDPDDEITQLHDGANDVTVSLSTDETMATEPLKLVFVPIELESGGLTKEEVEDQAEELVGKVRDHLPLAVIEYRVREVYEPDFDERARHPIDYTSTLWREESAPDEYYYGLSYRISDDTAQGRAHHPGYVAAQLVGSVSKVIGWKVMTHELGHNLSLGHAPGCDAGALDPDYPNSSNHIEEEKGWRMSEELFVQEDHGYDIMGYCSPGEGNSWFISQYNYEKAGMFYAERIATGEEAESDDVAISGGIVVAGTFNQLTHGWQIEDVSYTPHAARVLGPNAKSHVLAVIDSKSGEMLHWEPLLVTKFAHDTDPWARHWAVRIPVPRHDDFYLEIRHSRGRLEMQEGIRNQFRKLDIPRNVRN